MSVTKTRPFDLEERGAWYVFLRHFCTTEHANQAEYTACEQDAFRAWDALAEEQREDYRAQFRALTEETQP